MNPELEVMSLATYHSSIPRYHYMLIAEKCKRGNKNRSVGIIKKGRTAEKVRRYAVNE